MRKGIGVLLAVLVVFWGGIAWADSSASSAANATANAGAVAGAVATGGSSGAVATGGSARVDNVNITAPKIGVQVKVNPGQTVAPETQSSVAIDSHAVTNYINRQFLPVGLPPIGGTMQDFLPPKAFGYPWNFSPVIEGRWEKREDIVKKIKIKEIKEHCYRKMTPQKKVIVVTDHKVLIKGSIVGEVMIKGAEREDSRSIQMAAVDTLASWGANVIWIQVNALEHEAESSYSGFILGSGVGGVMAAEEKVASSGSGGIGKGSSRLGFVHYPIVHATGYRGKILKVEKKKVKEEKLEVETNGKKWQAIQ